MIASMWSRMESDGALAQGQGRTKVESHRHRKRHRYQLRHNLLPGTDEHDCCHRTDVRDEVRDRCALKDDLQEDRWCVGWFRNV